MRFRGLRAGLTVGAILVGLVWASPASAQRAAGDSRSQANRSLRSALGVASARALLDSDNTEQRIDGIERLAAIGSREAIDSLVGGMEGGAAAGYDSKARLTAVRALASHLDHAGARELLIRELSEVSGPESKNTISPLLTIVRQTAALALARAGTKKSVAPLLLAIRSGGPSGEAAGRAIRAVPPTAIEPLLEGAKLPPTLIKFLGDLGDLRAIEKLRPLLEDGDVSVQTATVVALAKLGDETALKTARPWLKRGDPRLLLAAAEALAILGGHEAPAAISALISVDSTRVSGLNLALRFPSEALAKPLIDVVDKLPEEDRLRAIAAIGRAGGDEAAKALAAEVDKGVKAKASGGLGARPTAALFALATMPGASALAAVEKLLQLATDEQPASLAIVRAGIVRALVRRETPSGLGSKLEAWATSKKDPSRAVAIFGLVALAKKSAADVLSECKDKKCDEVAVRAAARAALASSNAKDALDPFMKLLEQPWVQGSDPSKPTPLAIAAGVGLLAHPGGRDLPTSRIAAWAESGGPLAPLAARALPTRDDDVTRSRIKRLLAGSDPIVRAHVALGLGADPEEDAVALLASTYRFEEDPAVRAAVIRGIAERKESRRTAVLELARDLDPDDRVRALARAALAGHTLAPPASTPQTVAWVRIEDNDAAAETAEKAEKADKTEAAAKPGETAEKRVPGRAGRVVRPDGIAVPFVGDPDGILLLPGLPHQLSNLQLSSE